MSKNNVYLLLSGGIDSLACVHYYLKEGYNVIPLFIDYGQDASVYERKSAQKICAAFGISFSEITLSGAKRWGSGEIIGRNAFLLLTALMNCFNDAQIISIGIHSGVDYWDCTQDFINQMQRIFDSYLSKRISIDCPFIKFTKAEIYKYCKDENLPLKLTYSCEKGLMPPCGTCSSCKDIRRIQCLLA